MCCANKVMPIQFIDSNNLKSFRMGLTNHTLPISHHIMPLVINTIMGDTQAHTPTHEQKILQETRHTPPPGLTNLSPPPKGKEKQCIMHSIKISKYGSNMRSVKKFLIAQATANKSSVTQGM